MIYKKLVILLFIPIVFIYISLMGVESSNLTSSNSLFLPIIAKAPPPNIILIFADDLGYGDLGSYGQVKIKTPHLDQLASEGTRFTQFYSGASRCPTARNSLLTGLHTGHTHLRYHGWLPDDSVSDPKYLPRLLQNAGYQTAMFGKWGMGGYRLQNSEYNATNGKPENLGFDEFLGYMSHRDAHSYSIPPNSIAANDSRMHDKLWTISEGNTVEYPVTDIPYTHDLFIQKALNFIDEKGQSPFFLYLPLTIPHAELYVPPDLPGENLLGQYKNANGTSIFPEIYWGGDSLFRRPNPEPRATYAAMISRLDRDVGRIVDQLIANDLHQNTLIIFTSDNGPDDSGGVLRSDLNFSFDSNGGLRGRKFYLLEGGIRVPMIAWWPQVIPANQVIENPVALWDILPTFTEIAGISNPDNIDGVSLKSLLITGEMSSTHPPLYWEQFNPQYQGQAVRLDDMKGIRQGVSNANDHVFLYDLLADPGEQNDLSDNPQYCSQLQQIKTIMNNEHVPPTLGTVNYTITPLTIQSCP